MTTVNYTAKRSIIADHVLDTDYDLDMMCGKNDRIPKTKKKMHESISGKIETLRYRTTKEYSLVTIRIKEVYLPDWYEFLDSTDGGESFSFDRFGTAAVPNNIIQVKRIGDYREKRHGTTESFRISFTVREI